MALLDRRVVLVTGKGGVGKTVVATGIALAAARRGRRTAIVELAGQSRVPELLGAAPGGFVGGSGVASAPETVSIDPPRALADFLVRQSVPRAVARRLAGREGAPTGVASLPGARDVVSLAAVRAMIEPADESAKPAFDLVVVDCAASGHAVAMLAAPGRIGSVARVGPINRETRALEDLLSDRDRSAVVLVTRAEELPVTETLETLGSLETLGCHVTGAVVNARYPDPFSSVDLATLETLRPDTGLVQAAVAASTEIHARGIAESREADRLQSGLDVPVVDVPFVPEGPRGRATLDGLSARLEPWMERQ